MVDTEKYTINGTMDKTRPEDKNNAVVTDKFLVTDLDEYVADDGKLSFCGRVRTDRQYRCRLLHTACTTWAMVSFKYDWFHVSRLPVRPFKQACCIDIAITGSGNNDRHHALVFLLPTNVDCTSIGRMFLKRHSFNCDRRHDLPVAEREGDYITSSASSRGIRGIVSPLFVNPFLTKQTEEAFNGNISNIKTSVKYHKQISNMSLLVTTNGAIGYGHSSDNNSVYMPDEAVEMHGDGTRIHNTYLLAACFTFMAVISYLLTCLTHGNVYFQQGHNKEVVTNSKTDNKKLPKSTVAMFVFVVAVQIMVYLTSQRHLFGFFMTYAINKLEWTKRTTSSILLGFWIIFGLSRITVLLALRKIKEENLNWTYICIASLGTIGLTLSPQSNVSTLVVICLYISGFGNAPILSFMWSWFSSNITLVTGRITGLVYVSIAIGCMTVPVLSGYLMNNLSYDWFLYLYLTLSVLYVGLTVFIRILYKKIKHSK